MKTLIRIGGYAALVIGLAGCLSPEPEGLASSQAAATTVKFDFEHKPLPEIPLPNDIATRYDETSATLRRINASMIAPTGLERRVREKIDTLDGWGVLQPITIPFTAPIDVQSILDGHRDDFDPSNDVFYLIDVDPNSPKYGELRHLDVGHGNYPVALEDFDGYWKNDPRGWTMSIFFDEENEDRNGNGVLDPGEDLNGNGALDPGEDLNGNGLLDPPEDTDADGVLDLGNYLPGLNPARDDLAGRSDALMTFYERETNTVILRPMEPLRERTTYALVITRRLKDLDGRPVGSPFDNINHTAQTEALRPLADLLPGGLEMSDIAFAFSFTTQSLQSHWIAVRDGLYGHGIQKHLGEDYPAEIEGFEQLRNPEKPTFKGTKQEHLLYQENWAGPYRLIATQLQGQSPNSVEFERLQRSHKYVDYHTIFRFDSPQLFQRCEDNEDCEGSANWLPLDDQAWPADLDRKVAPARNETVYAWLTIPRKEVSRRKFGEQVPVVILGHGYTSNRFEIASFGGYFAQHGVATIAIDCPSHGISISPEERAQADALLDTFGLLEFVQTVFTDRSHDQNNDGRKDSGADFWTAYIFHTRDMVRQCGLDYMQLTRIIRSFDGQRKWAFDTNGDGKPNLAGDFDGDGQVDIGADSFISMTGGSLGGIMAMLVGSIEPEIDAIAPIAGGGGLGDIGNRSKQGGVREAVILRVLGPLIVGSLDATTGQMLMETIVPDLNDTATLAFAQVEGVKAGDTLLVLNHSNDNRGCGYVAANGTVRASIEADLGDDLEVQFFKGPALVTGDDDCALLDGATPSVTVNTVELEFSFQEVVHAVGEPLKAMAEGYGERRATPGMRRFLGLGQLVLDGGDPATYARHLMADPLTYPGTEQTTGTHSMIITTLGDMNVPASSGVAFGRAAQMIKYDREDPRYGKSINQLLLDTFTTEAVNTYKRNVDVNGNGVHVDIENYSGGDDIYAARQIPRLDPPLRMGMEGTDALGGKSGAIFPLGDPGGQHGFAFPGQQADRFIRMCKDACVEGEPCECADAWVGHYDVGSFMFHMLGDYFASGGMQIEPKPCYSQNFCEGWPEPPEVRDNPGN